MRYTLIFLSLIAVACGDEVAKKPDPGPNPTNNQEDMGLGDMADGGEQLGCALIDCDQNSRCVEQEGEAYCVCVAGFEEQDGGCAPLNDAPQFTNLPGEESGMRGESDSFVMTASDPNTGDQLTYGILESTCPFDIQVIADTGTATWICPANTLSCAATMQVKDDSGLIDEDVLTINCVRSLPVFTSTPPTEAQEHATLQYAVLCEDPEGGAVMVSKAPDDTCGGSMQGNTYVFTPDETMGGSMCLLKVACTNGETTETQGSQVVIEETNTAPSVSNVTISPNQPASPGVPLTCSYTFEDADGDADESTIEWLVNGSVAATGSATFDDYEEGDQVTCRVTPNDGEATGTARTSNTVTGPLRMIVRVGTGHSCVRTQTGGVTCWGHNFYGELGSPNSSTQAAFTPYALPHMTSGVTLMDLGSAFTCVVHNGQLKCWGSGGWSVLGPGITGHHPNPVTIFTSGVTELSAGATHMCVLHNGALKCWGGNDSGQVGNTVGNDMAFGGNPTPTTVPGMASGVTKFAAGEDHTCAIRNGALYCWGSNRQGQLGRATNFNTTTPTPAPALVLGLSSGVTDVVSGRNHTCARHNNVWKCWGLNSWSELGRTTTDSSDYNPGPVTAAIGNYTDIMGGGGNVCFVQNDALKCWGTSTSRQLNVDGIFKSETTRDVLPATVTSFDIGNSHLCAVQNNSVYCWGSNFHGQMGTGTKSEDPFPPTLINL